MKILFIGEKLETTQEAFKGFIAANASELSIATNERATFKDGTIVYVACLDDVNRVKGERFEEVFWVPPLKDRSYEEAIECVRNNICGDVPFEFREWIYGV